MLFKKHSRSSSAVLNNAIPCIQKCKKSVEKKGYKVRTRASYIFRAYGTFATFPPLPVLHKVLVSACGWLVSGHPTDLLVRWLWLADVPFLFKARASFQLPHNYMKRWTSHEQSWALIYSWQVHICDVRWNWIILRIPQFEHAPMPNPWSLHPSRSLPVETCKASWYT